MKIKKRVAHYLYKFGVWCLNKSAVVGGWDKHVNLKK